jgi:hypothetical protein
LKRIGLVLFSLLICLLIKFSYEILTAKSFFIKIGSSDGNKEYSFFVETGCKKPEVGKKPAQVPPSQPTVVQIQGVLLSDSAPLIHLAMNNPSVDVEDEEQREFELTIAQFIEKRLNLYTEEEVGAQDVVEDFDPEESPEFAIVEFPTDELAAKDEELEVEDSYDVDGLEESDSDFEAVAANFEEIDVVLTLGQVPQILNTPPSVDQVIAEYEVDGIEEAPSTDPEISAAEFDILRGPVDVAEVVEEVHEAESSIVFGDIAIEEGVETYAEMVLEEAAVEIAVIHGEVEGFEGGGDEVPSTEKELAAAEFDILRASSNVAEVVEEMHEAESSIVFGDIAIEEGVETYAEMVLEEAAIEIAAIHGEVEGLEAPSSEQEIVEAYSELKSEEVEIAFERIEVEEFEVCEFGEVPNTEKELAAAEFDIFRDSGDTVQIVQSDEMQETAVPIVLGEAAIGDQIEPYVELLAEEVEIAFELIEVEEFEVCEFREAPNTERELAATE